MWPSTSVAGCSGKISIKHFQNSLVQNYINYKMFRLAFIFFNLPFFLVNNLRK